MQSSSCWSIFFNHILNTWRHVFESIFYVNNDFCCFLSPLREQILMSAGMVTVSSCVPTSPVLFPAPVTAGSSSTQRAGRVKVNTHACTHAPLCCITGITHLCCPSRCERVFGSALQPQLLQHLRLLHMQLRGRIWVDVWWYILHRWDWRTSCFSWFVLVMFLN